MNTIIIIFTRNEEKKPRSQELVIRLENKMRNKNYLEDKDWLKPKT